MSDLALQNGFRSFEDVSPADSSSSGTSRYRARRRRAAPAPSVRAGADNVTSLILSSRLRVSAVIVRPTRVFRLRGTFVVEMEQLEDGTVFVRHRELPVHGYGPNDAAALEAFEEAFEVQWEHLVECPDNDLTPHARGLREQLRAAIQEIQPR